jgi:hypothetical protein
MSSAKLPRGSHGADLCLASWQSPWDLYCPGLRHGPQATTHAAELLKHDKDLESLSVGKFADVVAVPAKALADISLMKRVSFVMKDGVVYKRDGNAVIVEAQTTVPGGTAGTPAVF